MTTSSGFMYFVAHIAKTNMVQTALISFSVVARNARVVGLVFHTRKHGACSRNRKLLQLVR